MGRARLQIPCGSRFSASALKNRRPGDPLGPYPQARSVSCVPCLGRPPAASTYNDTGGGASRDNPSGATNQNPLATPCPPSMPQLPASISSAQLSSRPGPVRARAAEPLVWLGSCELRLPAPSKWLRNESVQRTQRDSPETWPLTAQKR